MFFDNPEMKAQHQLRYVVVIWNGYEGTHGTVADLDGASLQQMSPYATKARLF